MRKILFASCAVFALAMAGPAMAIGNSNNSNTNTNDITSQGGKGGAGGDGGTGVGVGVGVGIGQGGDAYSGSSSSVDSTNVNANSNNQGQDQGQIQGQNQYNSAVGTGNTTNTTVKSETNVKRNAIAPDLGGLANGHCTGESGGIVLGLPGFSGGGQYASTDYDCTLRYNIMLVHKLGADDLALEMVNDLTGVNEAQSRLERREELSASGASPAEVDQTVRKENRPFWCEGASATSNAQYAEKCE